MPPQKENFKPEKQEEPSLGPLIAIIIIVTLIIIGGLYAIREAKPGDLLPGNSGLSKDPVVKTLGIQGSSDDPDSIRKDLSATSINALYQDLTPLAETAE